MNNMWSRSDIAQHLRAARKHTDRFQIGWWVGAAYAMACSLDTKTRDQANFIGDRIAYPTYPKEPRR